MHVFTPLHGPRRARKESDDWSVCLRRLLLRINHIGPLPLSHLVRSGTPDNRLPARELPPLLDEPTPKPRSLPVPNQPTCLAPFPSKIVEAARFSRITHREETPINYLSKSPTPQGGSQEQAPLTLQPDNPSLAPVPHRNAEGLPEPHGRDGSSNKALYR